MEIYLAHTQGFCAGVARAIEIVNQVLAKYGTPLYVYHDIVHNKSVVKDFEKKGVRFVESLEEVPGGSRLIFSAHGVSPHVVKSAQDKHLHFIDATCPLVERVHTQAQKFSQSGVDVVLIGHKTHQEVVGTQGYVDPALFHLVEKPEDIDSLPVPVDKKIGYVTQTTLSLDETQAFIARLKKKFPNLMVQRVSDICYATQNRQDAIKELCQTCDLVIVCGSAHSSNSNRLKEITIKLGVESLLVDNAQELDLDKLSDKQRVGISSGASVPGHVVEDVIGKIKKNFSVTAVHVRESPEKKIVFPLPKI